MFQLQSILRNLNRCKYIYMKKVCVFVYTVYVVKTCQLSSLSAEEVVRSLMDVLIFLLVSCINTNSWYLLVHR